MKCSSGAALIGERIVYKVFPPITRHRLALYCGASGDLNPIHVDSDFAKSAGFPDVFAHGMLVMAFAGQALTDALPPHRIRQFSSRFTAITEVGSCLTCEGHMLELFEQSGDTLMKLALRMKDQREDIKLVGDAVVLIDRPSQCNLDQLSNG
ncbi:MaoC/PaaZ C-terminal domain-containing protein [Bradyrhizobium sp. SYSU BS000235]|uniref:MaoC/PaaZ C-terminal domain-containing protein n=1 Tax=Bradyrhizobium sp. SYSU BS000235 TaxID=3411332 RepID=UPI003C75BBBA